jgi:hypothetical protein
MRLSIPYLKVRDASLVVVVVLLLLLALAAPAGAGRPPERLDDLRMLGTHNSYHLRPDRPLLPNEPADYAHAPIPVQLSQQGVRSLELDAYNGPKFPVLHSLVVDTRSTCPNLEACFATIATWSKRHPKHDPLIVFVDPKAIPVSTNPVVVDVIGNATRDLGIANWDAAAFARLDRLVRKSFGSSLITPDDVRGKRKTLRDAVLRDGWPTVAKSRGKVLVSLVGAQAERDVYRTGAPSLEGRAMFANARPTEPSAAIISKDVPDAKANIPELVRRHFIVKTRADADGVEARVNDHTRADAALESGAQIVQTDYPVADPVIGPYFVRLRDRARLR